MGKRFALLVLLCLAPVLVQGANSMFDARVAVESQSATERDEATREGLRGILVRLTGVEVPEQHPGLSSLLSDPGRFVQQYGYDDVDDDLELVVRFDGPALQSRLVEEEIPIWAVDARPRTVAWVAVDRGGDRRILGGDEGEGLQETLRRAGRASGLPLLFPLMDLEDQRAVSSSDIWGSFRGPIMDASERYDAEAVLVGRIARRGDGWRARWSLFWDGDAHEWTVEADGLDASLSQGVHQGVTRLASAYARVPDPDDVGRFTLQVRDVTDLRSYAEVERYLRDLRDVEAVEPVRVSDHGVEFRLRIQGLSDRTLERLRSGRVLTEVEDVQQDGEGEAGDSAVRPDYVFRLRDS